jgi:uncharacterized protein (UPF0276 family)
VRKPHVLRPLGLGVGLDLPWGAPIGFRCDPSDGDRVSEPVARFLTRYAENFRSLFVSWQPKNRNRLDACEYFAAYDDLYSHVPRSLSRTLHQTTLNLGALERYDRGAIYELTNALVDRHGLLWVNEDLGLWSIHGRPLPYPLPPYFTLEGLRAAVHNAREAQTALSVPLFVEFPGFSGDTSLMVGRIHAYDFFRTLVEETGSPATLDVGHLLSYQWLRGKRGDALYDELDRLPTGHCLEIHLSGSEVVNGRFMDFHHGVLMTEQLSLLERLLPLCPNLLVVTYEDPKFDDDGVLRPETLESFERLRTVVSGWAA